MSINQHLPQNLAKIKKNKGVEYEANIILFEIHLYAFIYLIKPVILASPVYDRKIPKYAQENKFRDSE